MQITIIDNEVNRELFTGTDVEAAQSVLDMYADRLPYLCVHSGREETHLVGVGAVIDDEIYAHDFTVQEMVELAEGRKCSRKSGQLEIFMNSDPGRLSHQYAQKLHVQSQDTAKQWRKEIA